MAEEPKHIELSDVGEVLDWIYRTEWPVRLEFIYDGGWTWAIITHNGGVRRMLPRLFIDNHMDGSHRAVKMTPQARDSMETIHDQQRDWLHRGSARTVNEAVHAMACALHLEIPDSDFGRWWMAKILA